MKTWLTVRWSLFEYKQQKTDSGLPVHHVTPVSTCWGTEEDTRNPGGVSGSYRWVLLLLCKTLIRPHPWKRPVLDAS